mmetsp:Transcript_97398/g.208967  ORF Transcript_97398/g.208967 Transcript_97398/m.208967 type:complete len:347 (-) Transcript_97398:869-1909(-)
MRPRCHHVGVHGGEVQGCDAVTCADDPLGVGRVLQRPEEHEATWIVGHRRGIAIGHSQQVLVALVPLSTSDSHALRQLGRIEEKEVLKTNIGGIIVTRLLRHVLHASLALVAQGPVAALRLCGACRPGSWSHGLLKGMSDRLLCALRIQLRKFLERRIVPVDHVLLVVDVLRDDPLHHPQCLPQLVWDGSLSSHLPGELVHWRFRHSLCLLGRLFRLRLLGFRLSISTCTASPWRWRGHLPIGRLRSRRGTARCPCGESAILGVPASQGPLRVASRHATLRPRDARRGSVLGYALDGARSARPTLLLRILSGAFRGLLLRHLAGRIGLVHGEETPRLLDRLRHGDH